MKQTQKHNDNLRRLEMWLLTGASERFVKSAHDDLLDQLRSNLPAPDWEQYPVGRDFFCQVWP